MSQRTLRVAGEIRGVLGELLAREELRDPRVRGAGLITITDVRLSGDLREAWVSFSVYGAGNAKLDAVKAGLQAASGHLGRIVGRTLGTKLTPRLTFEIDRALDHVERVARILKDDARSTVVAGDGDGQGGDENEDGGSSDPEEG